MDEDGPPDPAQATTAAEYVAALARLRRWSGLTFRRLAEASEGALPVSTVAGVLGRTTLPREEFVAAFTAACGLDEAETERWIRARRALATGAQEQPDTGEEDEPVTAPPPRDRPGLARRWWAAIAIAAGLAVALLFAPTLIRGMGDVLEGRASASRTATAQPTPGDGWYRLTPSHVADRGMCVSEGRERSGRTNRPVAVQRACSANPPATYLKSLGPGVYEIQWHHPQQGVGCLSVDGAYLEDEALVAPIDCTSAAHQRFLLERARTGFTLRPVHSGKCLGILYGEADIHPGAELAQLACSGKRDQIFRFEPVDRPAWTGSG
ncbi:helix-turn-helix domain-containing protein [Nonomuraea sp. NPDC050790]|uniref:helix-turn-helix domain-containing protein n=1 Tax=Nonomuraea sp. NPDC050790 TaxID=3364371 RepID=UPI00379A9E0F